MHVFICCAEQKQLVVAHSAFMNDACTYLLFVRICYFYLFCSAVVSAVDLFLDLFLFLIIFAQLLIKKQTNKYSFYFLLLFMYF